jgi:uncharacterized protein (TIGR02271 family)
VITFHFPLQESSMNQTVVGVFNSHEAAERAAETLASQGFDRSQMHVKSTGGGSGDAVADTTRTSQDGEGTGLMASIRHFFSELFGDEDEQSGHYTEAVRRGGAVLAVEVDDSRLDAAREALVQCGAVDIEEQVSSWRSQGWSGHDADAAPYSREQAAEARQNVMPVVEEQVEVGKRQVNGGAVRVVSRVVSRPVSESVELRREEATIERRPVDRPATEADLAAMQERTIEVTEMAERPVVSKTARVVEEVVVGKQVSSETQTVEDTVRRTEVEVERVGGDASRGSARSEGSARSDGGESGGDVGTALRRGSDSGAGSAGGVGSDQVGATQVTPAGAMGSSGTSGSSTGSMTGMAMGGGATSGRRSFADLDDEFRQDYQTHFASSGMSYDDIRPAYRGGYEMRGDSRFANSDWDSAEPQLRQRWESENPGSAWERVKAAFRRGWDRATS